MSVTDMAMGRVFKDAHGQINSISFHRKQDLMVAADDGGCIGVFNTFEGKKLTTMLSSRYGTSHATFTHAPRCILHASTKSHSADPLDNNAVRYLSYHDNRYLRFFKGHSARVTSVSMSPKSDAFMTTGADKRLVMWDLRTSQAQAQMAVPGQPFAAFDEEGLVFAAACSGGVINLFDARQFDSGPFAAFPLPLPALGLSLTAPFTALQFSPDAGHLLAAVAGTVFLLDAFKGDVRRRWLNGARDGGPPLEASFSCDGQHVIGGTAERGIAVWEVPAAGAPVAESPTAPVVTWRGHPGVPGCVKWSPNRRMAVSGCRALVMWAPIAKPP